MTDRYGGLDRLYDWTVSPGGGPLADPGHPGEIISPSWCWECLGVLLDELEEEVVGEGCLASLFGLVPLRPGLKAVEKEKEQLQKTTAHSLFVTFMLEKNPNPLFMFLALTWRLIYFSFHSVFK